MRMQRDESGFVITTILLAIGLGSALIVGGGKTIAAVEDRELTHDATVQMRHLAGAVRDKGIEVGGDEGKALRARARQMTRVANALDDGAMDQIVDNATGVAVDLLLPELQGGAVVKVVQVAWDTKGYIELGLTVRDTYTPTDPVAIAAVSNPQAPGLSPADQAITEATVRAMRNAAHVAEPGLSDEVLDDLLAEAVVEMQDDGVEVPVATGPWDNPQWLEIADFVGIPPLPPTPEPQETTTTTTTSTTTTVPDRPAEPLRLTWVYAEVGDGHDVITFSIENVSGSTIEGIHFWNLDLPDENWAPTPPPWTLEPGEAIEGVARFRVSYYGLANWDVATGLYAEDWEDAYSNGVNSFTGEDYPWEEHLLP